MRALIPAILSLAAVAAGAAVPQPSPKDQAKLDTLLAGRAAGEPVSCLPGTYRNLHSEQVGPNTLIYYQNSPRDRVIWRNDPPGGCVNGGRNVAFVTQRPTTQTCRGDILQAFDPMTRIPYGSCALGDFVPYFRKGAK